MPRFSSMFLLALLLFFLFLLSWTRGGKQAPIIYPLLRLNHSNEATKLTSINSETLMDSPPYTFSPTVSPTIAGTLIAPNSPHHTTDPRIQQAGDLDSVSQIMSSKSPDASTSPVPASDSIICNEPNRTCGSHCIDPSNQQCCLDFYPFAAFHCPLASACVPGGCCPSLYKACGEGCYNPNLTVCCEQFNSTCPVYGSCIVDVKQCCPKGSLSCGRGCIPKATHQCCAKREENGTIVNLGTCKIGEQCCGSDRCCNGKEVCVEELVNDKVVFECRVGATSSVRSTETTSSASTESATTSASNTESPATPTSVGVSTTSSTTNNGKGPKHTGVVNVAGGFRDQLIYEHQLGIRRAGYAAVFASMFWLLY